MNKHNKAIGFMTTMCLSCVTAVFVGIWLDGIFHTTPWILLILIAYAIIANLYAMMKRMDEDDE